MRALIFLCSLVAVLDTHAHPPTAESAAEKLKSVFERAARSANGADSLQVPRIVAQGAKPEVLVIDGKLRFDGKELVFGRDPREWKKVIGGAPVCSKPGERPGWCKWDALGIEIATRFDNPEFVNEFRVRFQKPGTSNSDNGGGFDPDDNMAAPWIAYGAFPGCFQLEGFGIDAETRFWEIRAKQSDKYLVKCGLQTCRYPKGAYGSKLSIYMVLDADSDSGHVREFALSLSEY